MISCKKGLRVSGQLSTEARGLTLRTSDGDVWILEMNEVDPRLLGVKVIVEGNTIGYDRLKPYWVGADNRADLRNT